MKFKNLLEVRNDDVQLLQFNIHYQMKVVCSKYGNIKCKDGDLICENKMKES